MKKIIIKTIIAIDVFIWQDISYSKHNVTMNSSLDTETFYVPFRSLNRLFPPIRIDFHFGPKVCITLETQASEQGNLYWYDIFNSK